MTRRISITSTANDRLKAVRRLGRRPRREPDVLVMGHVAVRRALEAGARVHELYAAPELFLGLADSKLVALAEQRGARVYELGAAAFASISRGTRADGLVAVVGRPSTSLGRLTLPACPLVVVADAIERPGNLGAIVRTAAAAGADALVVCDPVTDPLHAETVRASVGTVFALPLAESTVDAAVPWLRERGIRLVVASPRGERPYWNLDYAAVAVVFGNERHGVAARWLDAADELVGIPMPGPANSLNVAVAAGVVLFEAARQRNRRGA